MSAGLKAMAPASVSNLACGFDALGMALDIPGDEIIGRWIDTPGVHIVEIRGEKKNIPQDASKNIAGITASAVLKHVGEEKRGLELKIYKHIQGGSGLGSSAASACAAAVLVVRSDEQVIPCLPRHVDRRAARSSPFPTPR